MFNLHQRDKIQSCALANDAKQNTTKTPTKKNKQKAKNLANGKQICPRIPCFPFLFLRVRIPCEFHRAIFHSLSVSPLGFLRLIRSRLSLRVVFFNLFYSLYFYCRILKLLNQSPSGHEPTKNNTPSGGGWEAVRERRGGTARGRTGLRVHRAHGPLTAGLLSWRLYPLISVYIYTSGFLSVEPSGTSRCGRAPCGRESRGSCDPRPSDKLTPVVCSRGAWIRRRAGRFAGFGREPGRSRARAGPAGTCPNPKRAIRPTRWLHIFQECFMTLLGHARPSPPVRSAADSLSCPVSVRFT